MSSQTSQIDASKFIARDVSSTVLTSPRSPATSSAFFPPQTQITFAADDDGYDSEATLDIENVPLYIGAPLERMARAGEVVVMRDCDWDNTIEDDGELISDDEEGYVKSEADGGQDSDLESGIDFDSCSEENDHSAMVRMWRCHFYCAHYSRLVKSRIRRH